MCGLLETMRKQAPAVRSTAVSNDHSAVPARRPAPSSRPAALVSAATTAVPIAPEALPPKWFLSFDPATKTFAFCLCRVDLDDETRTVLYKRALAVQELSRRAAGLIAGKDPGSIEEVRLLLEAASAALKTLEPEVSALVQIVDGATVDLFPGVADDAVPTVRRLQGVARYVKTRIYPSVAANVPSGEPLRVLVEYQMCPGAPTRIIMAALVTLFAEYEVIIAGPSLKNKVAFCEKGLYCHFAAKYETTYSANKAHTSYNFSVLEGSFGTRIPAMKPASLRGHVADSCMQVFGHLSHGPKNAADSF